MEKLDLRTPLQKERDERNKKIHLEYETILLNLPEKGTQWAVFRILGEKYGMRPQGIRSVIEKKESN